MHMLEKMDDVLEILWGNAMEADRYAQMACEMKERCRGAADWYRDMATKHLEFNAAGRTLFDRMRDEMRTDAKHAAHSEGALMVYEKQMAKLSRHCAQTRAMLDAYNK